MHISNLSGEEADEEEQRICAAWHENVDAAAARHGLKPPRLDILQAPYRSFINPILLELDRLRNEYPGRLIAVVTPEIVETRWWHLLLHARKPRRLRAALLRRGDHRVVLINVPWYVKD